MKRHRYRHRPRWFLALAVFMGGAAWADTLQGPDLPVMPLPEAARDADISVLTYNVKGLPWPAAWDRPQALKAIADRLALMRRGGRQPAVVVLQEAFIGEAKELGDAAGYRYQVLGPYLRPSKTPSQSLPDAAGSERRWYLGETQGTPLDSGLIILSDYPVATVARQSFPNGSCAGFDCLAAKGALMVRLDLPDGGRVDVLTTHFNSRGASKAPVEDTQVAYAAQARFLAAFVQRHHDANLPLVMAGDFNMGQRPTRISALFGAIGNLPNAHGTVREALGQQIQTGDGDLLRSRDAATIHHRARDMQFMFDGRKSRIEAIASHVPFGTEPDGSTLSDHLGFTIYYRIAGPHAS